MSHGLSALVKEPERMASAIASSMESIMSRIGMRQ